VIKWLIVALLLNTFTAQYYYLFETSTIVLAYIGLMVIPYLELLLKLYKTKTIASDAIDDNRLYWAAHKPDDFPSFMHSLWDSNSLGGYGVLCKGKVYLFRKGEFQSVELEAMPDSMFYIDSGEWASPEADQYLKNKVGSIWGWFNNCITVRLRVKYV